MKLFPLILLNLIFINCAFSQNDQTNKRKSYGGVTEITFEIGSRRRIIKVDVEGDFHGDTAWRESIKRRLNTLKFVEKGAKRGMYVVRVRYIVDKEGNVSDVERINDPGYGMGAESVRAVKASTKWGPGPVRPMKPTYVPRQS
jgi:hypothetical protein